MPRAFDPKCGELAYYFLSQEEGPVDPTDRASLAQEIQECVEDWFAVAKDKEQDVKTSS
jgi:hypothetical protein